MQTNYRGIPKEPVPFRWRSKVVPKEIIYAPLEVIVEENCKKAVEEPIYADEVRVVPEEKLEAT